MRAVGGGGGRLSRHAPATMFGWCGLPEISEALGTAADKCTRPSCEPAARGGRRGGGGRWPTPPFCYCRRVLGVVVVL